MKNYKSKEIIKTEECYTKPLIIFGSARSKGNTFDAVNIITKELQDFSFLDLADYQISDFDYEFKNKNDDFMLIVDHLLKHKTIIFATPVYWYTMSVQMKKFVDRITDLLPSDNNHHDVLRSKNLAVISSYGVHPEGKDGFEKIFINISEYLGMKYLGCYFHYCGEDLSICEENVANAHEFINCITLINGKYV